MRCHIVTKGEEKRSMRRALRRRHHEEERELRDTTLPSKYICPRCGEMLWILEGFDFVEMRPLLEAECSGGCGYWKDLWKGGGNEVAS